MKNKYLKRSLSLILAIILTMSASMFSGIEHVTAAEPETTSGNVIKWNFEDGQMSPFKLVSGEYGTIVSSIPYIHGGETATPYKREGSYHLSTYETAEFYTSANAPEKFGEKGTKMTKPSDSIVCELHSPMFLLEDPKVSFLIGGGGGASGNSYVALCDEYGSEVVRACGNGSEEMTRVEWDLTYDGVVGKYVFIKICDDETGEWGHVTFDDFTAKGVIDEDMEIRQISAKLHWSFENGALAPFTVTEGAFGECPVVCWINERNAPYGKINKHGNYYLSTVDMDNTINFCEAYTGTIQSPVFTMNEPTFSMKIGGGVSADNYVALIRVSDGVELLRYNNSSFATYEYDSNGNGEIDSDEVFSSGNMFQDVTLTVPDALFSADERVYLKIVDGTTSNWGFITVDDIRIDGEVSDDQTIPEAPDGSDGTDTDTPAFVYESVHWSFEDGTMYPFSTKDDFPLPNICDDNYEWNAKQDLINKDGNYYMSTIGTSSNVVEAAVGSFESIKFILDPADPTVRFRIAGGSWEPNYVAICDAESGEILAKVRAVTNGHVFHSVSLTVPNYVEGTPVILKVVDGVTSNWGFLHVDDFRFSGIPLERREPDKYGMIVWSFEDGTMYPFSTSDDFPLPNICDDDMEWNQGILPMNKDGKYYMSTIGTRQTVDETATGEFVSKRFLLNPASPTISFRIAGGGWSDNYVAICNAFTGEILAKTSAPAFGHPFNTVSLTVPNYVEGMQLVVKVVDGTTSNYGFLHVDEFKFSGAMTDSLMKTYENVIWSFEHGSIFPFTTKQDWGKGIIAATASGNPIPHGQYYLNTVLNDPGDTSLFDEAFTGELVSPVFYINPKQPVITMDVNGGGKMGGYISVYNMDTKKEVARYDSWTAGWGFSHISIDLRDKVNIGERLVIKIVDNSTSGWAWLGVDNIRGSFCFPESMGRATAEELLTAAGWQEADLDTLSSMIQANIDKYSAEEYPSGQILLNAISSMKNRIYRMEKNGFSADSEELLEWAEEMEELKDRINLSNPALGGGFMIFTVHYQYREDHHNTHNMFPAYNGEISDKAFYTPGGAVKIMNLATGEVTTLLDDPDGLFRDIDVSYDSDKILLSYRKDRDSVYNIMEYTLSDDRLSIVDSKQLTSLSTADDMDPLYLPSGDIVFSSTRDPKYVMCNRHISANLYRMESDGANIVKITSSTLFERPTDILPDGRILYDRWEYNDRDFGSAQGLWTVYADGTKQDTYYGNNSPTGAVIDAKAIPGTQKVMAVLSSSHDVAWGALAIIDRSQGVDGKSPVEMTWPASLRDKIGEPGGPDSIDAYKTVSIKYEDPQPLSDSCFLVSRSIPGTNNKMGIYLLDIYGNETLLYEDPSGMGAFDATIIAPREKEVVTSDRRNYKDEVGTFFVQDVYQGTHMEGVERGTVTTLRIVESIDKKYISEYRQWGGQGQQNPGVNWTSFEVKRVIGEVPVYEDGSAYFEVPQDVFVYFQLLDKDGRMIQSMRSGTLIQSGEQTGCVGCHEDRRTTPDTSTGHSTPMALEANVKVIDNPDYTEGSDLPKTIAINTPDVPQKRVIDFDTGEDMLVDWNDPRYFEEYTDLPTMNFLTEVQPIFTNNCLQCHGYDKKEANLSLVPDKDVIFNAAYINLWVNRGRSDTIYGDLVGAVGAAGTTFYNAKQWGSYNSPLVKKIFNDKTHRDLLTDAEKRRVAEWVDLNGTYYGDYCSNYSFNDGGRSPLSDAERAQIGDTRTLAFYNLTVADLQRAIYFDNPEKSPILKGKTGAAYDQALAVIKTGLTRLRTNPDVDWKGLSSVPGNPALSVNPYKQNAMDAWRTEKVALYDAMEAANRAAIVNGTKLYDKDHEAVMSAHNRKWPGWPTASNTKNPYTRILD